MKRKNRKPPKRRRVQHKKRSRISRVKRSVRKRHPVRRKKVAASRKRRLNTDPRVVQALGLMRREGAAASTAARLVGIKLKSFVQRAGKVLYRSGPGKPWKARKSDQLATLVSIPQPFGKEDVVAKNLRERKLAGSYLSALRMWRAAEDGAEAALKAFEGKTIGGRKLITDTKLLIQLEEADQLDVDNLYSALGGGS